MRRSLPWLVLGLVGLAACGTVGPWFEEAWAPAGGVRDRQVSTSTGFEHPVSADGEVGGFAQNRSTLEIHHLVAIE